MDIRREAIELDKVPEWLTGSPRMYSTLVPVASEWALPAQVRILFLSILFWFAACSDKGSMYVSFVVSSDR